jgi:hypothetical protein
MLYDDEDRILPGQPNCILCTPESGGYQIFGPFVSHSALRAAGRMWEAEDDGDPNWRLLYLEDSAYATRCHLPALVRD